MEQVTRPTKQALALLLKPASQFQASHVLYTNGAQGVLPCEERGVTASQLDLPSLTPLSVAGCGRLQLEAAHWATWVKLLQVVDN